MLQPGLPGTHPIVRFPCSGLFPPEGLLPGLVGEGLLAVGALGTTPGGADDGAPETDATLSGCDATVVFSGDGGRQSGPQGARYTSTSPIMRPRLAESMRSE
jgi:hypothetical protein